MCDQFEINQNVKPLPQQGVVKLLITIMSFSRRREIQLASRAICAYSKGNFEIGGREKWRPSVPQVRAHSRNR
jgi:hypothetical protein